MAIAHGAYSIYRSSSAHAIYVNPDGACFISFGSNEAYSIYIEMLAHRIAKNTPSGMSESITNETEPDKKNCHSFYNVPAVYIQFGRFKLYIAEKDLHFF